MDSVLAQPGCKGRSRKAARSTLYIRPVPRWPFILIPAGEGGGRDRLLQIADSKAREYPYTCYNSESSPIPENSSPLVLLCIGNSITENSTQSVPIENVVTKDHCTGIIADE